MVWFHSNSLPTFPAIPPSSRDKRPAGIHLFTKGVIKTRSTIDHRPIPKPPHPVNKSQNRVKPAADLFFSIVSKHAPRNSLAPRPNRATAHTRSIKPPTATASSSTSTTTAAARTATAVSGAAPAILRTCVAPEHEHGLAAFFVELFEEEQGFFFQAEAALLVAVHDVEGVLAPVVVDVVAFEGLDGERLLVDALEGGDTKYSIQGYFCYFSFWRKKKIWEKLTTGRTTSQGSLMATRKDLKIST